MSAEDRRAGHPPVGVGMAPRPDAAAARPWRGAYAPVVEPPPHVLEAFWADDAPAPLPGGEGRSWRAGSVVLKPVDDPVEWSWLGDVLPTIARDAFRIALPIRAVDGRWVVDGWGAQAWVVGTHEPRWAEIVGLSLAFDAACAYLERPPFIDARVHPWSVGDRVAWGEQAPPQGDAYLDRLLALRSFVDLPYQIVHGDLSENVLFADGFAPAVIDVTPYWRPGGFSAAVVLCDAVTWREADPEPILAAAAEIPLFPQLVVRAAIYRVVTAIEFWAPDTSAYAPVVTLAERLVGGT
jgi:uncharacterized protein (TIGR02569 family)